MKNLSPDLNTALKAARAGAGIVRERFGNIPKTQIKSESQTLVTETDLAAEKAILEVLKKHSNYGIISEESGTSGEEYGPQWVVDPLDGTSNFARGVPLFAVSIGLLNGSDGLVGVIVDPIHRKEYFALKHGGAFINGEPIPESKLKNPKPALFVNHGHRQEDCKKYGKVTQHLAGFYNLRTLGTTALELCYVASGAYEGFICSGDELWDFAAGMVIATEAGCTFTNWQGKPWKRGEDHLLFARPEIHEELVEKLKEMN